MGDVPVRPGNMKTTYCSLNPFHFLVFANLVRDAFPHLSLLVHVDGLQSILQHLADLAAWLFLLHRFLLWLVQFAFLHLRPTHIGSLADWPRALSTASILESVAEEFCALKEKKILYLLLDLKILIKRILSLDRVHGCKSTRSERLHQGFLIDNGILFKRITIILSSKVITEDSWAPPPRGYGEQGNLQFLLMGTREHLVTFKELLLKKDHF